MALKADIDDFIAEFSAVESQFVGSALRSLSDDESFVERSEQMLGVEARFTLLKRIAFARRIDPTVIDQIDEVSERAARLRAKRDALSRTLHVVAGDTPTDADSGDLWVPTAAEIDTCRRGTADLRDSLARLASRVDDSRNS